MLHLSHFSFSHHLSVVGSHCVFMFKRCLFPVFQMRVGQEWGVDRGNAKKYLEKAPAATFQDQNRNFSSKKGACGNVPAHFFFSQKKGACGNVPALKSIFSVITHPP